MPHLEEYEKYIHAKFENILNITQNIKCQDWNIQDLNKVLKALKLKQSPDTMGVVNEIFTFKNIGSDLKYSILSFCNKIKNTLYIPEVFKNVFITSIPKKRKSSLSLSDQRGIFLVPKLRSIFVKLVYNSIIGIIESNLSSSNIGARKNKAPRDHLFVLYTVINEG